MAYDDRLPDTRMIAAAGGAATTTYGKFQEFANFRLIRARAVVTVAGTAAGHGFDIYTGTSSIGTIALSTRTAGEVVDSTINVNVTAPGSLSIKSLADATGKADVILEVIRND